MYYLHYIRRTAVWGVIIHLICTFGLKMGFSDIVSKAALTGSMPELFYAFLAYSIPVLIITLIIRILWFFAAVKPKAKKYFNYTPSLAGHIFGALKNDIVHPVDNTIMFLKTLTRRHIIEDDSPWHVFCDFMQVFFGFIWTVAMVVFVAWGFLSLRG